LPVVDSISIDRILAQAETQISDQPGFFFAAMPPIQRMPKSTGKSWKSGKSCLSKKEKGEANAAKRWRAVVGRFTSDNGPKGHGQGGRSAATPARGNGRGTTSEAGTSLKGRWSRRRKPAGIGSTSIRWSHVASRTKY
jgi:hypothetical protein